MADNGSHIDITASDKKARRTIASFFRSIEAQARKFSKTLGDTNPAGDLADSFDDLGDHVEETFDDMEDRTRGYYDKWGNYHRKTTSTIGKEIRNLPEHLKPYHKALDDTRKHLRSIDQATVSFEEMSRAAVKSGTSIQKSLSVSSSGKSAIKVINQLNQSVKETQMAVLGLNKDGTVQLSTEQTQDRLKAFRRDIEKTKEDLEKLRDAGDFASYEAGMEIVERKLSDVDRAMRAAARGGEAYTRMITELGVNTPDAMNRAAIAMEAYKDTWIRNIQIMEARKGQAQKMLEILPQTSSIQRIDAFFLGIGNNLEKMAKRSTAASIALRQLGPNASMKDLQDRVMVINTGLMRMQMVAMAAGIALAGFTAAMFSAAKGPSQEEVFQQRGQLLLDYQKAVQDRTQEIIDTWSLFEKAEVEKTKPETLMKNLQGQVNIMRNWASNIDKLAKRGIDQGLLDSLRRMGPEAAGQIQALTQMSGPELDKYVALWKEKHALARKEALTELEGLRQETSRKIKELESSLTPLGISLAKAQGAWVQAMGPFVDIWGRIAAKVVDASTAIANFLIRVNSVSDDLTQMGGMFAYLATAISLILSPMAIGIGRAAGFAAAFGSIWMIAGPLILGLTRIAGIATVLSAAIVVVSGTLMKMWGASENLRNSVASLGTVLNIGLQQNIARIQPAINQLKAAMDRLLVTIFGSSKAGDIFKRMGDVIGNVITWLTQNVLPIFMTVMRNVFTVAGQAIQGIASFIVKIAPQVGQMVQSIVGFVKTLVATVTNGNTVIGKIFQVTWSIIQFLLVSAWGNIKAIITSGIAIITNIFQLFTNLLQGNWKAAFGNLVAIVKNVFILIWNYISLMALGRILGLFKAFFTGAIALFKTGWSKIHFNVQYFLLRIWEVITNTYKRITSATSSGFNSMLSIARSLLTATWNFIRSIFGTIYNFYVNIMRRIYIAFSNGWTGIKNTTLSFLKNVYGFIQSYFKYIYNFYFNILRRIYQIFNANWRNIYDFTRNIFTSVYKFLSSIFSSIYKAISGAVTRTRQWVSNGWNSLWSQTKTIFGNIKNSVTKTFNDIVDGAKKLPGRIGQGIKSMSKYAKDGAISMANSLADALGKGVNGAISGVNWVLGKIGVEKEIPKWKVPHYKAGTSSHPGGWFVAGDNQEEELIRFPDGRMTLSPPTDTLYYGEKGTEVLKGSETRRLLDAGLIPGYDSGVGAAIKKKAKEWLGVAKSTAGAAKEKAVSTAKKAKDVALDVWEYMDKPKELMAKVFAKYIPDIPKVGGAFTDIAKGSISYVKDKAVSYIKKQLGDGLGGAFTGKMPAGSGVKRWTSIASQALKMTGQYSPSNLSKMLYQMQTESGGNPRSINLWDSNAKKGIPSKGLTK